MSSCKHKLILISALSACIYAAYAFLLRHQVSNLFHGSSFRKNYILSLTASVIFGYAVVFMCMLSAYLILTKNEVILPYCREFLRYFIPLFLLLLLTWPGIFKGDEFYVLNAIRDYTFSPAQTGITSLFYICCLRFFPSMASIPFFQIIIISCIYAYIFRELKILYPKKHLLLCRLVCFFLPVLDGCLFTLRATLVSWVFLLVLCMCYFIYKRKEVSIRQLIVLSLLTGLVIAWRSEFIYMLVLLPLFLFFILPEQFSFILQPPMKKLKALNREHKNPDRKGLKKSTGYRRFITAFLCFCLILLSYFCFNIPNKIALNGSNKYPISLVINPLGNIFAQDEIRGENAYDDIMTINELIDVQALRKHPSVRNISQYWNIPDILPEDKLQAFMSASYDLILHNFDHFLYYRFRTFVYTNGMVKDDINHPTAPTVETIYTLNYYGENYRDRYYFMNPLFGETLRNAMIDLLACRHYDSEHTTTNIFYPVFYNCLPTCILALFCMILCLIRKKYEMAGILFLSGIQLVLIFLTAPAMFFMYYFCFYLSGYFLSALSYYELQIK